MFCPLCKGIIVFLVEAAIKHVVEIIAGIELLCFSSNSKNIDFTYLSFDFYNSIKPVNYSTLAPAASDVVLKIYHVADISLW